MNSHLLFSQAKKVLNHIRHEGFNSFFKILSRRAKSSRSLFMKPDIAHAFRFLKLTPMVEQPDQAFAKNEKTLNWFIPALGKGSGGHLNLFRFMAYLNSAGFTNRVVIIEDDNTVSTSKIKQKILDWYAIDNVEVYYVTERLPAASALIATSWQTAHIVNNVSTPSPKCYFVQDYEPWFYPAGTEQALAEQTYTFGFHAFTAGNWLADRLHDRYNMHAIPLGFAYDRELYRNIPNQKDPERKRVFFYVRPPTARRAFELGVLALAELALRIPEVTVVMAGWDVKHYAFPFECEHAGLQDPGQLAALYSSCDAALVLSLTNLSLLPMEIMACGVNVVSNRAGFTEWLLNDDIAMLAEPTVDSLANALEQVLLDAELSENLRKNALSFVSKASWDAEGGKMAAEMDKILSPSLHLGQS